MLAGNAKNYGNLSMLALMMLATHWKLPPSGGT